jgi:hypothetical protein
MGYPPVTIFVLFVIADLICRITQLILVKVIYDFDVKSFMRAAYIKPMTIALLMIGYVLIYNQLLVETTAQHVIGFVITAIVGTVLILSLGLYSGERKKCINYVMHHLSR